MLREFLKSDFQQPLRKYNDAKACYLVPKNVFSSQPGVVRLLELTLADSAIHLELLMENRIVTGGLSIGAQINRVRRAC